MSKKKKNEPIVISKEALMPTTIGSLETKESGPLVVIILLIIFVGIIIGLPYISTYMSDLKNANIVSGSSPTKTSTSTSEEEPSDDNDEDDSYYTISSDLSITVEGFTFTNITLDNEILSVLITNVDGDSTLFKNNDYYIELYDDDLTLLQRIKINNTTISGSRTLSFDISTAYLTGTPSKMLVALINESDYPDVTLRTSSDYSYLVCTLDNRELTYNFTTDNYHYLESLTEVYTYSSNNDDYDTILTRYSTYALSYDSYNGISASIVKTSNSFTYTLDIDLLEVAEITYTTNFPESYYYTLDTEAKIIAFEMTSSGYTCS